ncbi:MAG: alpha-amylase family glycosyl hydrolase [Treponemataceae bacterium]|nr:alpha-amylase family glycosyl hydrolase [Treponemataceae bacterium]
MIQKRNELLLVGSLLLGLFFGCTSTADTATSEESILQSTTPAYQTVAPGTIENMGHPKMDQIKAAHETLKPGSDEVVVYYLRNDKNYEPWGFWLWAVPGGDGAAVWDKTKDLHVVEGVGYIRFKKDGSTYGVKTIGSDGLFGVIPRKDVAWEKDGEQDRILDVSATNEWVIFQGDQKTYPYGPYVPSIEMARLVSRTEILLDLSGRYGLDIEKGDSGFKVAFSDGTGYLPVLDAVNSADPDNKKNNYTKKVKLILAQEAPLDKPLVVEHKSFLAPVVVNTTALVASLADTVVPEMDYQLGAIYDEKTKSVEFRLWSPFASAVKVRLFKQSLAEKADYTIDLTKDLKTGVWKGIFNTVDPDGFFYDYVISFGKKEVVALDPYARAMDAFVGTGVGRGAIINPAKADPIGGWEGYTDVTLDKREDAIIYEISVRDFTVAPDSGVKNRPGSYLAFIEKIPYLKDLGVTHVQLMPVLNFYYTNELKTDYEATGRANDNNYNWGYDPHNYFTPEGWFASNPKDPYNRIIELKTLIKELHKAGIGVILDVVYNHTATTALFENLVPGYYYRRDARGAFISQSGCGNDVASERYMASKLIQDSLYYWVNEYKVDGFRFDLMGLIDAKTILDGRKRIVERIPGKNDILFEGEGWKMYRGPKLEVLDQNYMLKTNEVAVFNDEFRDILKGGGLDDKRKAFVTGRPMNTKMIFENLAGRPLLNYKADDPGDSMNYVSAHDNLTLADNIAFNVGLDPAYPAERAEIAARAKLAQFLVLTGQPIAFIHGGCERGRSKPKKNSTAEVIGPFVHNSYDASDDINQFIWNAPKEYLAMAEWIKGLIHIRRHEEILRLGDAALVEKAMKQIPHENQLALGYQVSYKGTTLIMLVNANFDEPVTFKTGMNLNSAQVLVDSDEARPEGVRERSGLEISGQEVTVQPLTAVMLKL